MFDFIFRKWTVKLVVILLVMSLMPLVAISAILYSMSEELRSDFLDNLEEQFDEKNLRLDASLKQRIFEIDVLSHDILLQELLTDLPDAYIQNIDDVIHARYLDYAQRTLYVDTVLEIKVFDNDGATLFSLYDTGFGSEYGADFIDTLTSPQIIFDSDEKHGTVVRALSPIMNGENSEKIGMVLLVTDMRNFEPILLDRSGLKETGESYIVDFEKRMISESRFVDNAQFNQIVDTFAVNQCVEYGFDVHGKTYRDYRGEEIIGYSKCMVENNVVFLVESDVKEITSSLDVFQHQFLFVTAFAGIASLMLSLYLGRKIATPVMRLNNLAAELAKENFDVELVLKEKDEIGQLSQTMNDMGKKLNSKMEHLKKTNSLLERMSVVGEITARLSHDLRTPLNIISMATEIMREKTGDEKILNYVKTVDNACNSMLARLNDTLDYVKKGKLTLDEILISDVISEAISMTFIPDTIKINPILEDIRITGDATKLQVVFSNLISNAVEAIVGDGEITIRVVDIGDKIQIDFEDSGDGIPKENLDVLFDPLFTTKQTGTGLGLVSVKKIIESHGGTISVTSPPTIFKITLPKVSD